MPELFSYGFDGAKCVLYGLGRTNRALMRYLSNNGARLFVCDKRMSEKEVESNIEGIKNTKVIRYGADVSADFVFRTPGMRPDSPEIQICAEKGAVVTNEVQLFLEKAKGTVIGITGSDGKTTTSAVTADILRNAFNGKDRRVFLGGNIGTPLVDFLEETRESDVTVAELSSFQLMGAELSPAVSAVTNITENHLDWHKSMTEYIDSKCRIFSGTGAKKLVIDMDTAEKIGLSSRRTPEKVVYTSGKTGEGAVFCRNGLIFRGNNYLMDRSEIILSGEHNLKNYLTAVALTEGLADAMAIRKTAASFRGVRHRMTLVAERMGVRFYDSSIDSTPSRAISTLRCFRKPITVIVGGYDKNLDYAEFAQFLSTNVNNVVITGAASDKILREIANIDCSEVEIFAEPEFETAVNMAIELGMHDAERYGAANVVLSPGCASFDCFANYESRGDRFSEIIKEYIDNKC